jgi:hypothetical protein
MKIFVVIATFLFCFGKSNAQNIYSALTIPDSLKKDANTVIRDKYSKFIIKDINSAREEVHQVITILNEAGKYYLDFEKYSDKFDYLDEAEIKVYDALGFKKNTYSKKDMATQSYGSGLVPDGKVTYFRVTAASYPVTVEVNYTIKYNGLFMYPRNYLQAPYQAVEKEVFEVQAPSNLSFRYKTLNCNYQPAVVRDGQTELHRWQVADLAAYKYEKYSGSSENFAPQILLAPNKFQLNDYEGDMTSWKNFGEWLNKLYEKTTELKEDRKQFYRDMVKNAASENEKIKILYSYLQNNMRYVSIQLGIGGWRPFPASFVEDKKYGDCKALSNYLKSALDAVGIKSNLVVIYRDYQEKFVDEKFPMNDFNHVILSVPQNKDTLWLECTSNTLPFAVLDETTLNRSALLLTENGGVVINTPASNYKTNQVNYFTEIKINDEGGAAVTAAYKAFGEERSNLQMGFHDLKDDDKKKDFIRQNEWKQPDFFDLEIPDKTANPYRINVKMGYENIAAFKAGSKLFLEPRLYRFFDEEIPETKNRINNYFFDYPYQQTDTTIYYLPNGYSAENLPKGKTVNYPFAAYSSSFKWDALNRTITCIAAIQIMVRIVKPANYAQLLEFKNQVLADANEKIVVKKE